MNQVDQVVDEIRQIKEQFEAQVTGKHKQWPKAIKERVSELAILGLQKRAIANKTGISYHTVAYWCAKVRSTGFREVALVEARKKPKRPSKKSATVIVTKKSETVTDTKNHATVTVKTPDGFMLSIGSVSDALLVISGLRRGTGVF